jgi:DNA polymerase-3 subunit alpha
MAALMTADMRWTDRLAIEMTECKRMGIPVLGPDINESYPDFATVGKENKIRFGLAAIKGMGKALAEDVIDERDKGGKFKSLFDVAKRVPATKFNKKSWESSIKCGVFDSFGYSRSDLLYNLESIQAYANKCQKDQASGQTDLFGMMGAAAEIPEPEIKPAPTQYTDKEQLLWERELMGLYISAHPLDKYDKYFEEQTMPIAEIKPALNGASVIVGGIITDVRTLITKSGSKMAFVKIEDKSNEIEMVVFPRTFESVGAKLVADTVVKVTGKVNATDRDGNMTDEAKINAEEVDVVTDEELESYESTGARLKVPTKGVAQKPRGKSSASDAAGGKSFHSGGGSGGHRGGGGGGSKPAAHFATSASGVGGKPVAQKKMFVRVMDPSNKQALVDLKTACGRFPGMSEVILVIGPDKKAMRMPFRCECDSKLLAELKGIFGDDGVVAK